MILPDEAARDAVRAACHWPPIKGQSCPWPNCDCERVGKDERTYVAKAVIAALQPHIAALIEQARREEREACAALADMWKDENFRLASDTILTDRFLQGDMTQANYEASMKLADEGAYLAARAHCAQDIASAIRARSANP